MRRANAVDNYSTLFPIAVICGAIFLLFFYIVMFGMIVDSGSDKTQADQQCHGWDGANVCVKPISD